MFKTCVDWPRERLLWLGSECDTSALWLLRGKWDCLQLIVHFWNHSAEANQAKSDAPPGRQTRRQTRAQTRRRAGSGTS